MLHLLRNCAAPKKCPASPAARPLAQALHKIEATWKAMELTFSPYQDTDVPQLTIDDAVRSSLPPAAPAGCAGGRLHHPRCCLC